MKRYVFFKVFFLFFVEVEADFKLFHASNQGACPPTAVASSIWPIDTNLVYVNGSSKLRLTLQHTLVRRVIQDSIEKIQADILFTDAFPDATLSVEFAKNALVLAAEALLPATHDIHARLQGDSDYISKLVPVVRPF
jgi:hypothetical protein